MNPSEVAVADVAEFVRDMKGFAGREWMRHHLAGQSYPSFWSIVNYSQRSYEIRYSKMLRWLLDPTETHGLADAFASELTAWTELVRADHSSHPGPDESALDGDAGSGATGGRRRWGAECEALNNHIDVFYYDEDAKATLAIEVKQFSAEHATTGGGSQLRKYSDAVEGHETYGAPEYTRHYIFLTVGGDAPADESTPDEASRPKMGDVWVAMSYEQLVGCLQPLLTRCPNLDTTKLIQDFIVDLRRTEHLASRRVQEAAQEFRRYSALMRSLNELWNPDLDDTSLTEHPATELRQEVLREADAADLQLRVLKECVSMLVDAGTVQDHTPNDAVQKVMARFVEILAAKGDRANEVAEGGRLRHLDEPIVSPSGALVASAIRRTRGRGQGINFFVHPMPASGNAADIPLTTEPERRIYISGDSRGHIPNDRMSMIGTGLRADLPNGTFSAQELLDDPTRFDTFVRTVTDKVTELLTAYEA